MESLCECGIEPPGSISHGVSYTQMSQMKDIKGTHLKTNIKKIKEIIIVIVNKTIGTVQKSRYLGSIFDDGGTLEDVKNRDRKSVV